MTRAFIVTLNLDSGIDLASIASDIDDDLLRAGHDVESVVPWGAAGTGTTPSFGQIQSQAAALAPVAASVPVPKAPTVSIPAAEPPPSPGS